jgi:hypothetical protein
MALKASDLKNLGDSPVTIQSHKFPNVYLRMDGSAVTSPTGPGGGTVNCQYGPASSLESFRVRLQADGSVALESVAFPNVYLRMDDTGTPTVVKGTPFTVRYSTTPGTVSETNWIGIYPADATEPKKGGLLAWGYAPGADGSVALLTGKVPGPGRYAAWYFHDSSYTPLGKPVIFTVTPADPTASTSTSTTGTTLSIDSPIVALSVPLTVHYSITKSDVNDKNWIGIYYQGAVPPPKGTAEALIWEWAPGADSSVTLDLRTRVDIKPGRYAAWCIRTVGDVYTILAGPYPFTVT